MDQQKEVLAQLNAGLLRRGALFLEEKKWNEAGDCFNRVLDLEPENSEANLGCFMAYFEISSKNELSNLREFVNPFEEVTEYKRVVRFCEPSVVEEINGYLKDLYARRERCKAEEAKIDELYEDNRKLANLDSAIRSFKEKNDVSKAAIDYPVFNSCGKVANAGKNLAEYDKKNTPSRGKYIAGLIISAELLACCILAIMFLLQTLCVGTPVADILGEIYGVEKMMPLLDISVGVAVIMTLIVLLVAAVLVVILILSVNGLKLKGYYKKHLAARRAAFDADIAVLEQKYRSRVEAIRKNAASSKPQMQAWKAEREELYAKIKANPYFKVYNENKELLAIFKDFFSVGFADSFSSVNKLYADLYEKDSRRVRNAVAVLNNEFTAFKTKRAFTLTQNNVYGRIDAVIYEQKLQEEKWNAEREEKERQEQIQRDIERIKAENKQLKAENDALGRDIDNLNKDIDKYNDNITGLRNDIRDIR